MQKSEAQKSRELRLKYAAMGRESGYLSKREADDFGNERKVAEWEGDYFRDKNSASGRARERERAKAGAQIQNKINRMAKERGYLDRKDYQDFSNELDEGRINDKRGKATGKASFYIANNPLKKGKS